MPLPRIALCSFSYGANNGIARMDQSLTTGLRNMGYSVAHFVIPLQGALENSPEPGIRFLPLEQAYEALREEFANIDIVLFNGSVDPCVSFAAADAGVPVLAEIMHQYERGGMYPGIDCVICVSDFVARQQTHPSCKVIPNAIDLERFSFKPGRRDKNATHVLQVANQGKVLHVSIDEIIPDIIATHPDTCFTSVGGRSLAPHPALKVLSAQNEMEAFYHAADLNFLAAKNDAFGLTTIEGMACGCLPIASTEGGASEIIRHGETGWLVRGDKNDWLAALRAALDGLGSSAHASMQEKAREFVAAHYSQERCTSAYAQLLEQLWAKFPERRRRNMPQAWRPLVEAVFIARSDLNEALSRISAFVAQGKTLEPELFRHPNGAAVLSQVMQTLLKLESPRAGELIGNFCKLLRHSRVQGELLDALENKGE